MPMPQKVVKLIPAVEAVLRESRVEENLLFLPPRQLDRSLYVAVNSALELLGGKWNRGKKAHVFDEPVEGAIVDALATGAIADHRKTFQFFETPAPVADELVAAARISAGMRVLEPSAGRGRILLAIHRRLVEMRREDPSAGLTVHCCELMPGNWPELRRLGYVIESEDFFELDAAETYDRIVANPPFSRGQDMAHVRKMARHLAPGGRVAAIMSPGWTFRQDRAAVEFRDWLELFTVGYLWEELPDGSFAESGTNVRAGILTFNAREIA